MPITISKLLIHPSLWRILGFGSSVVGFTCYAMSPSFYDLFGKLNLLKIVIYSVPSLILCTLMLLVKKCRGFTRNVLVRAHVGFLVLMLTSLYSFWEDRVSQQEYEEKGSHGRILDLCSCGAFGLMSLSLSRQLELGFEVGISNFFVGCFLVMLMKMNFKLAPVAAILCYVLINIRYLSDFLLEMRDRVHSGDTVHEDVESGSRNIHSHTDDEAYMECASLISSSHCSRSEGVSPNHESEAQLFESTPTGVPEHLIHKNRLQEHAQRSHIPLPIYETVNEGLAHAPRFRSTVWVDGKSYTSENVFPIRKAAEQDAAKLAFERISTGVKDEGRLLTPEKTTPFKSILNEYAAKMNLDKITYDTDKQEGLPGFVSSLVFNGKRYTGEPAKSKKEAEQLAARAAVLSVRK